MAGAWVRKRVLIVVRTYPTPAQTGIEVSCTAAITEDGQWIRIYPIPYRFMEPDQKFTKYQWISVDLQKAQNDIRPESYKLDINSIRIESSVGTANGWQERKDIVLPLRSSSMCSIRAVRDNNGSPTLGIFRPKSITELKIVATTPDWSPRQRGILSQQLLPFQSTPDKALEKIPYEFRYRFNCDERNCSGHDMICTDWEMGQSYRSWRGRYGATWEEKFRERYEHDMKDRYDTHFFVGNLHQFPNAWIVVGLFYPPKTPELDLFHD